jgi:hypothetical protein
MKSNDFVILASYLLRDVKNFFSGKWEKKIILSKKTLFWMKQFGQENIVQLETKKVQKIEILEQNVSEHGKHKTR